MNVAVHNPVCVKRGIGAQDCDAQGEKSRRALHRDRALQLPCSGQRGLALAPFEQEIWPPGVRAFFEQARSRAPLQTSEKGGLAGERPPDPCLVPRPRHFERRLRAVLRHDPIDLGILHQLDWSLNPGPTDDVADGQAQLNRFGESRAGKDQDAGAQEFSKHRKRLIKDAAGVESAIAAECEHAFDDRARLAEHLDQRRRIRIDHLRGQSRVLARDDEILGIESASLRDLRRKLAHRKH
jgi:hypothetical protein